MHEIMINKFAGVRMCNDVGGSAEDLWYEDVPDCSSGGSSIVAAVTEMVAEAYRTQTKLTRHWIGDDAAGALKAINDMWDNDQYFAATFKRFTL
jgi:hypothetical protein